MRFPSIHEPGYGRFWRPWFVIVFVVSLVASLAGLVSGTAYWAARIDCDHWQHDLRQPTRLDVWGPGCVVEIDGQEIPVGQYYVYRQHHG